MEHPFCSDRLTCRAADHTERAIALHKLTDQQLKSSSSRSHTQCVMNLVATHYNCTSPMAYISHHALHTHIPVHHYTNHTAVTIHSLVLIVSPHLHHIHSHTFKQHSHMHSLRSLVLLCNHFRAFLPCMSPHV